ncbi:hypothetical protein PAMP_011853 [Pampus punctatissimus]
MENNVILNDLTCQRFSEREKDPSSHPRQKPPATDLCYTSEISSLMDFNSPDASLDKVSSTHLTDPGILRKTPLGRGNEVRRGAGKIW